MCYNTKAEGIVMQTLYIDVYFLINFSVDFLALYFACSMIRMPTTIVRLLLGGTIGALTAIVNLFLSHEILGYSVLFAGFCGMIFVASRRVSLYRRFKLAFCFSIVEMLLGGLVHLAYGYLDRNLGENADAGIGGSEHRGLLLLAVIVLLSIGVFKCLVSIFTFTGGSTTVEVDIRLNGRRVVTEALVDTGNLAKDPFDMRSVMLVGSDVAEELLNGKLESDDAALRLGGELQRRLRLIPVNFGKRRQLLMGFLPDAVYVGTDKGLQEVDVVIAVDKEGGKYGGRSVLMPSVVIRDVL